jgi:hypothetical protein
MGVIMTSTALETLATTIADKIGELVGIVPQLVVAALGVAVLIFGVRVGWRLVKSLARG